MLDFLFQCERMSTLLLVLCFSLSAGSARSVMRVLSTSRQYHMTIDLFSLIFFSCTGKNLKGGLETSHGYDPSCGNYCIELFVFSTFFCQCFLFVHFVHFCLLFVSTFDTDPHYDF